MALEHFESKSGHKFTHVGGQLREVNGEKAYYDKHGRFTHAGDWKAVRDPRHPDRLLELRNDKTGETVGIDRSNKSDVIHKVGGSELPHGFSFDAKEDDEGE